MQDFIEELRTSTSPETWKVTIENITQQVDNIIKNNLLLKEVFGNTKNKITFTFYDGELQARIKKFSHNDYEIQISTDLILLLLNYSYQVSQKFNLPTERQKDEVFVEKIRSSLFYYWIEIIFLHEISHLFRKHLELMHTNEFHEFYMTPSKTNVANDLIYYEMDADRYAGKLFAAIFHLSLDTLKKHVFLNENNLIEKFAIEGSMYLFDLLYKIDQEEEEEEYRTHPHPKQRMVLFLLGIQEAKYQNNNIFNMTLSELEALCEKKHIDFIDRYYDDSLDLYVNQIKLLDQYNKFIKNKGLV